MQSDELLQEIADYIQYEIRAGYEEIREIPQIVAEVFGDRLGEMPSGTLRPYIEKCIQDQLHQLQLEQMSWPLITDYDRLVTSFAELESQGIVARQKFTCCGTCGAYEIADEMAIKMQTGEPVIGYTFFHMQDTESAVAGHDLFLNYGSLDDLEASAIAVGQQIVKVFEANGLQTKWDGDWSKRIYVVMAWQRRLQNGIGSQLLN